jgi:hypothetical protein
VLWVVVCCAISREEQGEERRSTRWKAPLRLRLQVCDKDLFYLIHASLDVLLLHVLKLILFAGDAEPDSRYVCTYILVCVGMVFNRS